MRKLGSWAKSKSKQSIYNGLIFADNPETNDSFTKSQMIHAAKYLKPEEMIAFLFGYINHNYSVEKSTQVEFKDIPNMRVWIIALKAMMNIITHSSEEFLARHINDVKSCILSARSVGLDLIEVLEFLNDQNLIMELIGDYEQLLASACEQYQEAITAAGHDQILGVTDDIVNSISDLPPYEVTTEYSGVVELPGVFAWAASIGFGSISLASPEIDSMHRIRTHHFAYSSPGMFGGDNRYRVTEVSSQFIENVNILNLEEGQKFGLIEGRFKRQLIAGNKVWIGNDIHTVTRLTDSFLLTHNSYDGMQIETQPLEPVHNDEVIDVIASEIQEKLSQLHQSMKIQTADDLVSGIGLGRTFSQTLESLEATRLCLYTLLCLIKDFDSEVQISDFLLSKEKLLRPLKEVLEQKGRIDFPKELENNYNYNDIMALIFDADKRGSRIELANNIVSQLSMTHEYVHDVVAAIPTMVLTEYRANHLNSDLGPQVEMLTQQVTYMANILSNVFAYVDPKVAEEIINSARQQKNKSDGRINLITGEQVVEDEIDIGTERPATASALVFSSFLTSAGASTSNVNSLPGLNDEDDDEANTFQLG